MMQTRTLGLMLFVLMLLVVAIVNLWRPPAESPPAPVSTAEPTYALRFGHNIPEASAMHQAALRFADAVARKSDGRVMVKVFPEQQLGNDHQMVEMARNGELDILLTPTAKMSVPVPAMQYADLPFLFPSREDAYALLDGEVGKLLLARMHAIGLRGVTFWENGFKHFTGNRPLLEPADFDGLDIRVMKSRILMEQFRAFGAHPVPIDFHATRKALADGVVDGQENPLIAIVSMGFHQVQSDLTLSGHGYLPYVLSFSEKAINRLPEELQRILSETALEMTDWERGETQRREAKLLQAIRDEGVRIHTLDEASRREFEKATAYIADRFEPIIGADIMSKTEEYIYKKYQANREGQAPIVIGIDADLSMDAKVSGLAIKRGAGMAVRELNSRGGVLGRPLLLLARDHQGLPSKGVENIERFAEDPNVVAIMGGQHGSVVNTELETIHSNELPFLLPWAAFAKAVESDYEPNFVFRISANDRLAAPYIIDYATRNRAGPAILYENSVWGRGVMQGMLEQLLKRGLRFTYTQAINRGSDTDFGLIIDEISSSGADTIVMVLKPEEGGALLEALAAMQRPLPLVSHWGIVGGEVWKRHKAAISKLDLAIFQTFSFLNNSRKEAGDFASRYISYYGLSSAREINAPAAVAQSYDLVRLLANAIERAGSTQPQAVRDALENLPPYEGVVKRYEHPFSPNRHDALDKEDYRMVHFSSDGALEPLP